jgi:hypothetical protein
MKTFEARHVIEALTLAEQVCTSTKNKMPNSSMPGMNVAHALKPLVTFASQASLKPSTAASSFVRTTQGAQ